MNPDLIRYIEKEIIPQYAAYDRAHQADHIYQVIANSLKLAKDYPVDVNMVYTVAAYHDIGLKYGRHGHETASKKIVYQDQNLEQFFSQEEIIIIGEAVEDHRASIEYEPRSIYGKIVSEADRDMDLGRLTGRTIRFIKDFYPQATYDYILNDTYSYLVDKYGPASEINLWLDHPLTQGQLKKLRSDLADQEYYQKLFDSLYWEICK